MEELLTDLKERGFTHVYPDFCYITAFTEACLDFEDRCLTDDVLFKVMPQLWEAARTKGFPLDIRPQVQPLPCSSVAEGSVVIDPYGDLYKCWELVGLKDHIAGHINPDGSFEKKDPYSVVLNRNPTEIKNCNNCKVLPACGSGCVCKALWREGTYNAPGCGSVKFLLRDQLKTYVKIKEAEGSLIKDDITSKDMYIGVIESGVEPRIKHCYTLV
jgi:uncharacterized protein